MPRCTGKRTESAPVEGKQSLLESLGLWVGAARSLLYMGHKKRLDKMPTRPPWQAHACADLSSLDVLVTDFLWVLPYPTAQTKNHKSMRTMAQAN